MSNPMTPEERAANRFPAFNYRDGGNESRAAQYACAATIREEVEPLEAENAKLRALVQVLVDATAECRISALTDYDEDDGEHYGAEAVALANAALFSAKEAGFTPTNTEDK